MQTVMSNILEGVLRSLLSMLVLFLLSRMLGPRQISQMSLYDYILGITIGSIAATMAIDYTIPVYVPIVAMAIYAVFTLLMSMVTNKSIKARKFLSETPKILIENGKIVEKNLRKTHIDLNDLTSAARVQGIFDLDSVLYAVIENTGSISFLQRRDSLPLTPKSSTDTEESSIFANIIIDGKIMPNALRSIGKDKKWLDQQLREQNIVSESEVLLAVADSSGKIRVYRKYPDMKDKNYFM